ncbi:MAG: DUF2227 family putative metal-binding protein [Candidatus Brocadiales bacterium]|nr:DUF2227 family putative metal-binding protein [Candidatus Brocadiales bacterium]
MPNKSTHDAGIVIMSVGTFSLGIWNGWNFTTVLYTIMGMFLGVFVTPDLDLYENCRGTFWCWFWKPYGKMFRHRGISHTPIIGTLTRIVYAGIFPAIYIIKNGISLPWNILLLILLGLCLSDTLHVIMDRISTWIKVR